MADSVIITVLMPVYNAEKYIAEAIESILNQTYTDFEFLIINDGSTDNSLKIIESYKDKRIRLINNETNIRLIATLNKGIDLARGKYIARMDADDISLPQRLEKQYTYMESHPEVGLLGSYIRTLGLENNYDVHFKTTHDEIKFKLFFDTHFPHPAAMIRKSVLIEHDLRFEKAYIHAEDYDLWNRMSRYTRLAVIPEILVHKRVHPDQISVKHTPIQLRVSSDIRRLLIKNMSVEASDEEIELYDNFLADKIPVTFKSLKTLLLFFDKLITANQNNRIYKTDLFNTFFAQKHWDICTKSSHYGLKIYKLFIRSQASCVLPESKTLLFLFFIKSLFRYKYES